MINKELQQMQDKIFTFARTALKTRLAELPEGSQKKFKLMYGLSSIKGSPAYRRTAEQALLTPIADVVDEMPEDKLDWALQQVENTRKKLAKEQS